MRQSLWPTLAIVLAAACAPRMPEPTPTPAATATPIPTPTITPTPTRVPHCPAPNPDAAWIAPADFAGYPDAIGALLDAGGSADALRDILTNASSISAQFGGVWTSDLTGEGDPETIVSIYDPLGEVFGPVPAGDLLIYGCRDGSVPLLYRDAGPPMLQAERIGDLVGAGRGGQVAIVRSQCGVHTCFDTLDVLGWDGAAFVSLMGERLQMPQPTYTLENLDGDAALEIRARSGQIASVGAGPQRTVSEVWDWNGAQFVRVGREVSPPEYRIHVIHDADAALLKGDVAGAMVLYERAISDEGLRDWLVEIGLTNPGDRANLTAYAWYRILVANVRLGDAAAAQTAFDRLSAALPVGAPGHAYEVLAQVFWSRYLATNDLSAACQAANAHANSDTDAIDGLNAFGYANREYVAVDMCPFIGP